MLKSLRIDISYWLFLLMPSTLLLPKIVSSIFIILIIVLMLDVIFKEISLKRISKSVLVFSLLYFFSHLLSLSYTNDLPDGLRHLQGIISFLLFPIIGFTLSNVFKSKFRLDFIPKMLETFVVVSVLAALYCLLKSTYNVYLGNGRFDWWFFYRGLSSNINLHPIYFSYYLNLVLVILLFKKNFKIIIYGKILKWILIAFVTIFLMLLSGRNPLIVTFIIWVYFILKEVKLNKTVIVIASIFSISIASIILFQNERFKSMTEYEAIKQIPRYNTWSSAVEVVADNWLFGLPYGDIDEALYQKYLENNYEEGAKFKYNCHNQYLQQFGYFGILGFTFILLWFYKLYKSSDGSVVFRLFLFSIMIYLLTENLFSVNKGIIFTSYFFTIISIYNDRTIK